jgi:hypothetical protein
MNTMPHEEKSDEPPTIMDVIMRRMGPKNMQDLIVAMDEMCHNLQRPSAQPLAGMAINLCVQALKTLTIPELGF